MICGWKKRGGDGRRSLLLALSLSLSRCVWTAEGRAGKGAATYHIVQRDAPRRVRRNQVDAEAAAVGDGLVGRHGEEGARAGDAGRVWFRRRVNVDARPKKKHNQKRKPGPRPLPARHADRVGRRQASEPWASERGSRALVLPPIDAFPIPPPSLPSPPASDPEPSTSSGGGGDDASTASDAPRPPSRRARRAGVELDDDGAAADDDDFFDDSITAGAGR